MAEEHRGNWNSGLQFILTCIGYAVGLGNIWRFPSLAYENGGGAFLIPYIISSFVVGLPILYMELCLGQFASAGASTVFRKLAPAFQGIGWCMSLLVVAIGSYYTVIIAWVMVYMFTIITGNSYKWSSCTNVWNSARCSSTLEDALCSEQLIGLGEGAKFFNFTCMLANSTQWKEAKNYLSIEGAISPAEQFFENYVLEKTDSMFDLGGLNYKVIGALAVVWTLTALALCRGVKWIGRISLFTATFPYFIIVVLFFRGITLDGAKLGIDYYLLNPDFSVILKMDTWRAAATQVCYSLSVGFAGMLSLASYNEFNHNCFKDAIIIATADASMSVFGGTAVFSVLGFMAKELNVHITEVIQSGIGLAFIAYPEAMSRMPLPWLWSFFFFTMIFMLGSSTLIGLTEVLATTVCDSYPRARPKKHFVVIAICLTMFLAGISLCTKGGIFYFQILDTYLAGFTLMLLLFLELFLVSYIYGLDNFMEDIRLMVGPPRNCFTRIIGPSGFYLKIVWWFIAPVLITIIGVYSLIAQVNVKLTYGKGKHVYDFPSLTSVIGWGITIYTLIALPIFFFYNLYLIRKAKQSFWELFRVQPDWPSYERIQSHKAKRRPKLSSVNVITTQSNRVAPEKKNSNLAWKIPPDTPIAPQGQLGNEQTKL